ncbi:DUF1510 family protein [Domibacillus enclensis]|uniref:DUF1510 domain-containing protein n=1 Tax=Domibacillus enclensis TaxID=1017273 RepID=A0A1N6PTJ9_9BACI|nr:DUF1510 family protein [Domibacillus enclensis]OXS80479.1 hypothetical protein B1B05_03075 [Domibacillus enclensis]SIQ07651.1 Protein of unknown function [Domibacillus enclensis]
MDQSSRAERKTKRRKTNRILNTAIAVVVLLIIIVGFTIFAGGNNDEEQAVQEETQQEQSAGVSDEESDEPAEEPAEEPEQTEEPAADEESDEPAEEETKDEETVVSEGTEPNVEQDIVNPGWESVGTSQSGEHTNSFEMDSTDWQEKEQALAYATGIPLSDMTVWYISGNGPQAAIGTVSPKSNQNEAYRVHIEWVDGEGWKPTKVQKLKENDKGR